MATAYFNSLVNNYYVDSDPNRRTILEAKTKLADILSSRSNIIDDFSRQRSLLVDTVANIDLILEGKKNELESFNYTRLQQAIAILKALPESQLTTQQLATYNTESAIVISFVKLLNDKIGSVLYYGNNILDNIGIMPTQAKDAIRSVFSDNSTASLVLFNNSINILAKSTSPSIAEVRNVVNYLHPNANPPLASALQSQTSDWWSTSVTPNMTISFQVLNNRATQFFGTFASSPITVVFSYFDRKETVTDYDRFIQSTIDTIIERGAVAGIIETGGSLLGFAGNILSETLSDAREGQFGGLAQLGAGAFDTVTQAVDTATQAVVTTAKNGLDFISQFIPEGAVKTTIEGIGEFMATLFPIYRDGVSETRYGMAMERSWSVFLNNLNEINVNFLTTTPLDPRGNGSFSLYGNMMLGAPLTYTETTDPNNRNMINTFVKDSTFLSLTPGMPKYNGGAFQQEFLSALNLAQEGNYLNQTTNAPDMFAYLLKNGIDYTFAQKDRRYYKFDAKYEEYFSYLETMLNTIWLKMGLGTTEDGKFNIFSFFDPAGVNTQSYNSSFRRELYKSSIGFYVNPVGNISEGINNSPLTTDLSVSANSSADAYQRLNYITGMGTAGGTRDVMRQIGIASQQVKDFKSLISSNFSTGGYKFTKNPIRAGLNLAQSIVDFSTGQDMSALMQQFSVTNGMRVIYPMLWESSGYTKNMQFDFNFVSPYGDPLSIFQYVYVPFFSLLAFAMPRQAAENGLVSPFFVRADVPGWITSDLAMITDVVWTKGGPDGSLWTKDKLPRAISGSFTVTDLYPYLAMVKRISFLSSNPSFTVFLDNMAGLRAIYNDSESDPYAEYWRKMLTRITGEENTSGLWNRFNTSSQQVNSRFANSNRESLVKTINKKAAPWLSKV